LFEIGDTFWNNEVPGIPTHPWVVLSRATSAGKIVIANFSTMPPPGGSVLSVSPSELRSLNRPSHLRTDKALLASLENLQEAQKIGAIRLSQQMPPAITEKCIAALLASKMVSGDIKKALGR
jgi:hypothetical protein